MSRLLRRLAAPMIALGVAAGMLTHVEAASASCRAANPEFIQAAADYRIAAITNCDGRREQFMRGDDNYLYHRWQDTPGGEYTLWYDLGASMILNPSVARNTDGRLDVFWINSNHEMRHKWQDAARPGGWSDYENFHGILYGSPENGYYDDGRIWVRAQDALGFWHSMEQSAPSRGPWLGWY